MDRVLTRAVPLAPEAAPHFLTKGHSNRREANDIAAECGILCLQPQCPGGKLQEDQESEASLGYIVSSRIP